MSSEAVERRLAAILAADVVGYSRLMGEDEAGTLARLNEHRKVLIDPAIKGHQGRIVKTTGDGLLAEFASVVEAVRCAVHIQHGMAEREAGTPDDRKMLFRIGVNLGDVIVEGDDIFGDGVNVAARIEALADPGGVFISGDAFRQIRNKLDVGFENLGEKRMKNIAEPVSVYRVLTDAAAGTVVGAKRGRNRAWLSTGAVAAAALVGAVLVWNFVLRDSLPTVEAASMEMMAFPLPDKPSIVVLPFDNLSGDSEQQYFADGLTDDVITALSKLSGLFVISRKTAFTFRGEDVSVKSVAEELGVRYVLDGSVRRAGDQVRINAQLVDATTGKTLWAERSDGDTKDIFALQDDINARIVSAMAVELTGSEQQTAAGGQCCVPCEILDVAHFQPVEDRNVPERQRHPQDRQDAQRLLGQQVGMQGEEKKSHHTAENMADAIDQGMTGQTADFREHGSLAGGADAGTVDGETLIKKTENHRRGGVHPLPRHVPQCGLHLRLQRLIRQQDRGFVRPRS